MARPRDVLRTTALALALAVAVLAPGPARARPDSPVLHEPIPPDPREDLALDVVLDGDLPAALRTPGGGIVPAPDPRQLPRPSESSYGAGGDHDTFVPDRETRRPEVGAYDDPFTPSTAPFKRLEAFDAVRSDYRLYVRDPREVPVSTGAAPGPDDESFYADLVVDVGPDRVVRIPSVGPGARIARARLGVGATEVPMRILRDGADNWFVQAYGARGVLRARLVLELVIARAAFGGPLSDPSWTDLSFVPPLPENVMRDAATVREAIGVSRRMRPRAVIAKLVEYFRGFTDSDEPPRGHRDVYLDLALSKKGVCRHRAFAFMVTAQSLGIPARMVLNEAHAWVEVHDGSLWRRIDLGGAGHMQPAPAEQADRPAYEPPPDAFGWPRNAEKGDDMVAEARARGGQPGGGSRAAGGPGSGPGSAPSSGSASGRSASVEGDAGPGGAVSTAWSASPPGPAPSAAGGDEQPPATVRVDVAGAEAHCGQPLRVRGEVSAAGDPCPHVAIELWLRGAGGGASFLLGRLATGDDGAFSGSIVVPSDAARGDYDVVARTSGDARCGPGTSD